MRARTAICQCALPNLYMRVAWQMCAAENAERRRGGSWQELARTQWTNDSRANEPDAPHPAVKPLFGGDGSYEVSFSPFGQHTKVQEQIDPVLKETKMARKMLPVSVCWPGQEALDQVRR